MEKIKLFERQRRNDLSHKCGVYAIFVNSHTYVGSSENLSRRLSEHRVDIPKKDRGCRILHELYKNNSKEDFYYTILEYCTSEKRLSREKYYISILEADCNTAKDPQNPITRNSEIFRYDNNGNYLCRYVSVSDAARKVGGTEGNISVAARKYRYAYNSLWSYEKNEYYPHTPQTKIKTKKVYMFSSVSFTYLQEFDSISKAARFIMAKNNKYKKFDSLCNTISHYCSKQQIKDFSGFCFSYNEVIYIPKQQE